MTIAAAIKAFFSKRKSAVSQKQIQSSDGSETNDSSKIDSKDGLNFQYKDGRRFQNEQEITYVLPNDYEELDRIHQQHWMFRYILQRNFTSPLEEQLEKGIRVLDSGCGPGTWTLEMAESYPSSTFYGVDASCVFPENIKPANVEFSIGNIAKQLPFPDNHFDFIYQRLLLLGLTSEDWDNSLKELFRVLKPGGYIELLEADFSKAHRSGPLIDTLQNMVIKMMESRNLKPSIVFELEDRLSKAGYTLRLHEVGDLNINHTDKGGELFWSDFKTAYIGLRPALATVRKEWADAEVFEEYMNQVGLECKSNKTYASYHIFCAQKVSE